MNAAPDVTALLQAWSASDTAARDRVIDVVYQELRRRATGQLRRVRRGHTLQPTALVHEAYLRWSISGTSSDRTGRSSSAWRAR